MKHFSVSLVLSTFLTFSSFGQTEVIQPLEKPETAANLEVNSEELEGTILDITDPELNGLMASPNPTKGYLSVSIPPNLVGHEIRIMDMTGRFIGKSLPITSENVELMIDGDPGIYFISIQTEKEIITERILLDL